MATMQPITSLAKIKEIKTLLAGNPRDFALFVVGLNVALRASDLLALSVGQLRGLRPGDSFTIREQKNCKKKNVTVNSAVCSALKPLLTPNREDHEPVFKSAKGGALSRDRLHYLIKQWTKAVGLRGSFGSHTPRKTWGYMQRTRFGVDIPTLMTAFNHSTQRQTLTYLCIQPEEVKGTYMNQL